jgi:hypothetical protein
MTIDRSGAPQAPDQTPADRAVPTRQSAFYVVLTTVTADSGMVFGNVNAVAVAESVRLLDGPGARGALVAAYVRMADALVPVDVETTALPERGDIARYRVRTWLGQQLLGQHDVEIPLRCG